MSLANLGEIQTAIQARGYGSDAAAAQIEFINACYREIVRERRWSWREATTAVAAVVGNPAVSLAGITDLDQRPDAVRIEIGSTYLDLEYVDPEELRRREHLDRQNGVPEVWTYYAGQLRLYPRPDKAYTVDVDYFKKYAALAASPDVPLIPEEYRDVLVDGPCQKLAQRERDWHAANAFKADYEQGRAELRAADARHPRQTSSRVKQSGFFFEDSTTR